MNNLLFQTPLASLYGAIAGLCELGPEVIKTLVVPKIKAISDRIESTLDTPGICSADKNAVGHIKSLISVRNLIKFSIRQRYGKFCLYLTYINM